MVACLLTLINPQLRLGRTCMLSPDPFDPTAWPSVDVTEYERPSTAEELKSYLLRDWEIKRVLSYKTGGFTGRFAGAAQFERFEEHERRDLVTYAESGCFTPEVGSTLETSNRLLYEFTDKVEVFYDE